MTDNFPTLDELHENGDFYGLSSRGNTIYEYGDFFYEINPDFSVHKLRMKRTKPEKEPTREEVEAYSEKLLAKFKQDPYFEQKQEFGRLLMIHVDDFTPSQKRRFDELDEFLKDKY